MKGWLWGLLVAVLVGIDQVSKFVFREYWPDLVSYNTGSAFSLPIPMWIAILASFVFLGFVVYLRRVEGRDWVFALLFAGAAGNLIDRMFMGRVTDFIDVGFWPVFNVADSYLSVGAVVLIWYYVFKSEK